MKKPQSEEYQRFENLLGRVLSVSKEELNRRLKENPPQKRVPKASASRDFGEASRKG